MMFPKYRVYVEFDGLDAKEEAEKFKEVMDGIEDLFPRKPPLVWRISEERED